MDTNFDFEPNSHKYHEEQKKELPEPRTNEKIVTGEVKRRKKSEIKKFRDAFIPEDVESVKSYIFSDLLIPSVKDLLSSAFNALIYGKSGGGRQNNRSSINAPYVSYRNYSDGNKLSRDIRRECLVIDDIILESRGDAEEVLDRLGEIIQQYGVARVTDLYDMIGESCDYTLNKYGWTSIKRARIVSTPDGYLIDMPRPMAIDR